MSSGGGGAPANRDLYAETSGELTAKANLAPQVFATESQYDPQYAGLNLSTMDTFLNGSPGGSTQRQFTDNVSGFRNSQTGEFVAGDTAPAWQPRGGGNWTRTGPNPGQWGGGVSNVDPWTPFVQQNLDTRTINTPASRGYLGLASDVNTAADAMTAASNTRQRASNISDAANLGPQATQALMAADPQQAQLMQSITDNAQQGMDAGTNLTPAQMRLVQQSVRQGQSARGQGFGNADTYGEAMGVSQYGQQLQQQRIANAGSAAQQRFQYYGAPAMNMATAPGANNGNQYLSQGYGISSAVGPKLFGSDINANDIANSNFNAANARNISDANNSAALTSAGISGGVGIASAGLLALALS